MKKTHIQHNYVVLVSVLLAAPMIFGRTIQDRGQATKRPVTKQTSESRVALVIGNSAYRDAPLPNPVNDARGMAAALKNVGFDVTRARYWRR